MVLFGWFCPTTWWIAWPYLSFYEIRQFFKYTCGVVYLVSYQHLIFCINSLVITISELEQEDIIFMVTTCYILSSQTLFYFIIFVLNVIKLKEESEKDNKFDIVPVIMSRKGRRLHIFNENIYVWEIHIKYFLKENLLFFSP